MLCACMCAQEKEAKKEGGEGRREKRENEHMEDPSVHIKNQDDSPGGNCDPEPTNGDPTTLTVTI